MPFQKNSVQLNKLKKLNNCNHNNLIAPQMYQPVWFVENKICP